MVWMCVCVLELLGCDCVHVGWCVVCAYLCAFVCVLVCMFVCGRVWRWVCLCLIFLSRLAARFLAPFPVDVSRSFFVPFHNLETLQKNSQPRHIPLLFKQLLKGVVIRPRHTANTNCTSFLNIRRFPLTFNRSKIARELCVIV